MGIRVQKGRIAWMVAGKIEREWSDITFPPGTIGFSFLKFIVHCNNTKIMSNIIYYNSHQLPHKATNELKNIRRYSYRYTEPQEKNKYPIH